MNRFVIVHGLPYLLAHGKTYSVRMGEIGFTVGAEVKLASVPARTFSELSVRAKCAGHLDSISAPGATQEQADELVHEPELEDMTVAEIKAFAEQHGIDLGSAKKKADILKVIRSVIA